MFNPRPPRDLDPLQGERVILRRMTDGDLGAFLVPHRLAGATSLPA